jgi:hypothetical protein
VFQARDDQEDRGSHGMFDAKAHPHDPWSAASMHRRWIATGVVGVAAATTALLRVRR